VCDRLRTMTGVIQNGHATHAEALSSFEELFLTRFDQFSYAIAGLMGGSFQFVPHGQQLALPPPVFTGASYLPSRPVPLPITGLAQAEQLPQYRMSRTVQTIPELWQEWTLGLGGQPSIEKLDELYGSGWRSGPSGAAERQFYSRRKSLITEIRRLAIALKDPPDQEAYYTIVLQLEDQRRRAKASLSKVIDTLKEA
jgi:Transcriptional activator of glycolytic enzymes